MRPSRQWRLVTVPVLLDYQDLIRFCYLRYQIPNLTTCLSPFSAPQTPQCELALVPLHQLFIPTYHLVNSLANFSPSLPGQLSLWHCGPLGMPFSTNFGMFRPHLPTCFCFYCCFIQLTPVPVLAWFFLSGLLYPLEYKVCESRDSCVGATTIE